LLAAAHAPDDLHSYPISGLRPGPDSEFVWYLDQAVVG
jgi:hypothetical protein